MAEKIRMDEGNENALHLNYANLKLQLDQLEPEICMLKQKEKLANSIQTILNSIDGYFIEFYGKSTMEIRQDRVC